MFTRKVYNCCASRGIFRQKEGGRDRYQTVREGLANFSKGSRDLVDLFRTPSVRRIFN